MENSLILIAENISEWWDFLWATEVPQTGFSFGALYAFLLIVSLGLFLLRLAIGNKDKDGSK